jgi:hypothetical protein
MRVKLGKEAVVDSLEEGTQTAWEIPHHRAEEESYLRS